MESKKNFGNHIVKNTAKNIVRLQNDCQLILGQDIRMQYNEALRRRQLRLVLAGIMKPAEALELSSLFEV